MAHQGKGPKDICPQQERFPSTADGLMTNTKPLDHDLDYERESGGEFEVPRQQPGHDCFMWPSTTKGKKE
jgi:hypothetical protein